MIYRYRASLQSFKPSTRDGYALHARKLAEWRIAQGATFPEMTEYDFLRYLDYRRKDLKNSEPTIRSVIHALRNFYNWALDNDFASSSPVGKKHGRPPQPTPRDTLSVSELRAMWDAAPTTMHRALVGLLGLTGMRPEEVLSLEVTDLTKVGDYYGFPLPNRKNVPINSPALLSPEVHAAVLDAVGNRRTGPLLIRADGQRLDRRTSDRWVKSTARRAGITMRVSQMTLSFSMRAISIEHGFSYVGVIRAIGEVHPTKGQRWFTNVPSPQEDHAALRLCRLIFNDPESSLGMLADATTCLNETDLAPAVAAVVVGASLEKHLRDLCDGHAITFEQDAKHRKIGTYITQLSRRKLISRHENQRLTAVQSLRDDAAHGWFHLVAEEDVHSAIRECSTFIRKHPVPKQ